MDFQKELNDSLLELVGLVEKKREAVEKRDKLDKEISKLWLEIEAVSGRVHFAKIGIESNKTIQTSIKVDTPTPIVQSQEVNQEVKESSPVVAETATTQDEVKKEVPVKTVGDLGDKFVFADGAELPFVSVNLAYPNDYIAGKDGKNITLTEDSAVKQVKIPYRAGMKAVVRISHNGIPYFNFLKHSDYKERIAAANKDIEAKKTLESAHVEVKEPKHEENVTPVASIESKPMETSHTVPERDPIDARTGSFELCGFKSPDGRTCIREKGHTTRHLYAANKDQARNVENAANGRPIDSSSESAPVSSVSEKEVSPVAETKQNESATTQSKDETIILFLAQNNISVSDAESVLRMRGKLGYTREISAYIPACKFIRENMDEFKKWIADFKENEALKNSSKKE